MSAFPINAAGEKLIKSKEQLRLKAYPDPKTGKEPWTVGWGETGGDIHEGTTWTKEYADERFIKRMAELAARLRRVVVTPLNENQWAALMSIVDNVGWGRVKTDKDPGRDGIVVLRNGKPSTLLRYLNAGNLFLAGNCFLSWVSPGSNVENGLRIRRNEEVVLWKTPSKVMVP